jgi:hypothetical protein
LAKIHLLAPSVNSYRIAQAAGEFTDRRALTAGRRNFKQTTQE